MKSRQRQTNDPSERCEAATVMAKAEIDDLLELLDQHSSSWLTAKPVAALIRSLLAERDAALAAVLAVQEYCAQEADEHPDTLESIGEAGSGKFRSTSKTAAAIRALKLDPLAVGRALIDAKDAEIAALRRDAERYRKTLERIAESEPAERHYEYTVGIAQAALAERER